MALSTTQTFMATVFILGVGVFVLMASGVFIGYAAAKHHANSSNTRTARTHWYLLGIVALWFSIALATSTAGTISLPLVLPFALIPIVGGFSLSFLPPIQALIRAIPMHWLIFLQTYRVAGGVFIFPYLSEGILTRGFAINAGIGDMITGVAALLVGWLVLRHGARYQWVFLVWTAFGILDLLVAPASAAYFGFAVEGVQPSFPITIIPLFFGPPFGILIHLITVRNFWLRYKADGDTAVGSSHPITALG